MLVISWIRGIWKIVDPRYKKAIHHAHTAPDELGMLAMNDCCDLLHHHHRQWNTLADELTHWARETRSSWDLMRDDQRRSEVSSMAESTVLGRQIPCWCWMGCADVGHVGNWPRSQVGNGAGSILCHAARNDCHGIRTEGHN